jgi:hypothetical protein
MSGEREREARLKRAFVSLLAFAALAVALQSLVFSGASFTSSSGNPGTILTAGDLGHTNSMDGQLVVDAAGILPGGSKAGTLTISGTGDLPGAYTLAKTSVVDTPASPGLSTALVLTVEDITTTPRTLSNTTVASFTAVSLGTVAPGQARQYRVTLAFPAGVADPGLQGASLSLGLQFTGVTQ